MSVTVEIPDTLVKAFAPEGDDLSRAVLEAMALEGYRSELITEYEIQQLLGFPSRMDVHGFLKQHGVCLNYGMDDLENDIREADRIVTRLNAREAAND